MNMTTKVSEKAAHRESGGVDKLVNVEDAMVAATNALEIVKNIVAL